MTIVIGILVSVWIQWFSYRLVALPRLKRKLWHEWVHAFHNKISVKWMQRLLSCFLIFFGDYFSILMPLRIYVAFSVVTSQIGKLMRLHFVLFRLLSTPPYLLPSYNSCFILSIHFPCYNEQQSKEQIKTKAAEGEAVSLFRTVNSFWNQDLAGIKRWSKKNLYVIPVV